MAQKLAKKISIKVVAFPAPLSLLLFIRRLFVFVSISDLFSLTMSLKVILLIAVPMFVICCAILLKYWDRFKKPPKQQRGHHKIERVPETVLTIERVPEIVLTICFDEMSDNRKEAVKKMAKPIFICADCWLLVFDFLAPSQLGLGIALINRRFDRIVDEHFKTRKWKLGGMQICHEIGDNGTKQMQIVNSDRNPLPIPQNPLPSKVIGFHDIQIIYIDQNVIAFLRFFHRFFAFSSIFLDITENVSILDCVLLNILPMFRDFIIRLRLNSITFRRFRQLAPSLLSDCPSLRLVYFNDAILPEFPPDERANASDGQALTKWLFTPHPNGLPKELKCFVNSPVGQWSSMIEQFKAAFSNASSPVAFCISFFFPPSSPLDSVVLFDRINELTGEILSLQLQQYANDCCLFRLPIAWDGRNWKNAWEDLHARQNPIYIRIKDGGFDDGLRDAASPGPSDH